LGALAEQLLRPLIRYAQDRRTEQILTVLADSNPAAQDIDHPVVHVQVSSVPNHSAWRHVTRPVRKRGGADRVPRKKAERSETEAIIMRAEPTC
jgi:hypothetical protein